MQIFIKALTGKITTLDVELADTIGSLKQQLSEKEGIPLWTIRLFYNGRGLLEDDQSASVEYYRIHDDDDTFYVLKRTTARTAPPARRRERSPTARGAQYKTWWVWRLALRIQHRPPTPPPSAGDCRSENAHT